MKIASYREFCRLFEQEGDYIGGNDWPMDQDWANTKDERDASNVMDFDGNSEEEDETGENADIEDNGIDTIGKAAHEIKRLKARVDELEKQSHDR